MGNRAVVAFDTHIHGRSDNAPAVYLHWNGGPTSVQAALTVANEIVDASDNKVGIVAAFSLVAGIAFNGSGLATGEISTFGTSDIDNGDNGTYWVSLEASKKWEITKREFRNCGPDDGHDADEMLAFVRTASAMFLPATDEEE